MYPECQFKIDTYSLFVLHSFFVLSKKGIACFILPNTLLDNFFEKEVRNKLLSSSRIYEICDLNDKVFESAVVHAMIIAFVKESFSDYDIRINTSSKLNGDYSYIPKSYFEANKQFSFNIRSHHDNDLLQKLKINSIRLEEVLNIRQAIKSGDDSLWISNTKESDNYKPILRGKDIGKYCYSFKELYIDYGKHLACPRTPNIFEQPKILIREAGASIIATYDDKNYYIMSSLYNAIPRNSGFDLKYLLALLNSSLYQYLMNLLTFEKTKGAFTKAKIYHYYDLPVKNTDRQSVFIEIVNKLLEKKKNNIKADIYPLEQELNSMIYNLYNLTDNDISIIKGGIAH